MIHLSTSHVVPWPTPAGPSVAPVVPVAPVAPVRETGRETGRDAQGAAPRPPAARTVAGEPVAAAEAALPRLYGPAGTDGRSSGSVSDGAPGPGASAAHQKAAEKTAEKTAQKAEQAAAQAEEEQAQVAAERASAPLQAVLATVWEASAAVVERALGRLSGAESEVPGGQSDTAPDLSAVAAAQMNRRPLLPAGSSQAEAVPTLPWPVLPPSEDAPSPLASSDEGSAMDDLVAYDEHGNGSRAPIEAGSLISERV